MSKAKNILLGLSLMLGSTVFILGIKDFIRSACNSSDYAIEYTIFGSLFPSIVLLVLAVPAVILFFKSLKSKRTVALPIICLLIATLVLFILLIRLMPGVAQYVILQGINLLDNAFLINVLLFFSRYRLLLWMSSAALIAGSVLSLIRKKESQNEA